MAEAWDVPRLLAELDRARGRLWAAGLGGEGGVAEAEALELYTSLEQLRFEALGSALGGEALGPS